MNRELVLCRRCRRILGCREPVEKSCEDCVTHDCPLLPAPESAGEGCRRCPPRGGRSDFRGPGTGVRGVATPANLATLHRR